LTASTNHKDAPLSPPPGPLLIVLSGLSGVGKDTVLSRLRQSEHPLDFIVTVTTRPQRPTERDGVHYHFVSDAEFREMINTDKLLEYASVYGYYYGVPAEPVRESLRSGRDVVVKVDVQGASTIKKIIPEAVLIFLAASSMEELASRLKMRSTESPSDLELRLKTAEEELAKLPLFDYLVVNRRGEINRTVADINAVITAEKCRIVAGKIQS
jgi:guanylate kinase